jgi:hypothetical protein
MLYWEVAAGWYPLAKVREHLAKVREHLAKVRERLAKVREHVLASCGGWFHGCTGSSPQNQSGGGVGNIIGHLSNKESNFDLAERLNRFLLSRGTRLQISSWSLRLRFNLSFWTNRGNYHGFNSTIWLYMLSYEPHVKCEQ